jgi:hypothetical protein
VDHGGSTSDDLKSGAKTTLAAIKDEPRGNDMDCDDDDDDDDDGGGDVVDALLADCCTTSSGSDAGGPPTDECPASSSLIDDTRDFAGAVVADDDDALLRFLTADEQSRQAVVGRRNDGSGSAAGTGITQMFGALDKNCHPQHQLQSTVGFGKSLPSSAGDRLQRSPQTPPVNQRCRPSDDYSTAALSTASFSSTLSSTMTSCSTTTTKLLPPASLLMSELLLQYQHNQRQQHQQQQQRMSSTSCLSSFDSGSSSSYPCFGNGLVSGGGDLHHHVPQQHTLNGDRGDDNNSVHQRALPFALFGADAASAYVDDGIRHHHQRSDFNRGGSLASDFDLPGSAVAGEDVGISMSSASLMTSDLGSLLTSYQTL